MDSCISKSSPRVRGVTVGFKASECLTLYVCWTKTCVCRGCDTLRHPPSPGGIMHQHCHHHGVLVLPDGSDAANTFSPYPSTLSLDPTLNTMCHLGVYVPHASIVKWEESKQLNCEDHTGILLRDENVILSSAPSTVHTWTCHVPTIRQTDTDGANMRDVSSVAREKYLLARWKPNAVNYTACLPNHSSPREMGGQDKLVIPQKQSIWKDDVLSAVRSPLPALWNRIMVGNRASYEGQEGTCACIWSGVVGWTFLSRLPLLKLLPLSPVCGYLFLFECGPKSFVIWVALKGWIWFQNHLVGLWSYSSVTYISDPLSFSTMSYCVSIL